MTKQQEPKLRSICKIEAKPFCYAVNKKYLDGKSRYPECDKHKCN